MWLLICLLFQFWWSPLYKVHLLQKIYSFFLLSRNRWDLFSFNFHLFVARTRETLDFKNKVFLKDLFIYVGSARFPLLCLSFSSCHDEATLLWCSGFLLQRLLLLQATGSRTHGPVAVACALLELGLGGWRCRCLVALCHVGSSRLGIEPMSPVLAGGFLTPWTTKEAPEKFIFYGFSYPAWEIFAYSKVAKNILFFFFFFLCRRRLTVLSFYI